ncbi:hypothetical protein [Sulfurimonas sp.]|uniref:hypothetical protein n=1 Tax=Sulfurimonas sp. TaxID=2022749 RepID=UPI0019DADA39|nr:hypothetical protein [Sulfurimonas sp.]MBE0515626.1 hypothetical protein [Sulfurimonas sp.]
MSSKKFIAFVGLFAFLIVGFVGGVNYVVDPYGFNNLIKIERLNSKKISNTSLTTRFKANLLESGKFDTIMLGTSRIGVMNPEIVNNYLKSNTFNLEYPGSNTIIQNKFFKYAKNFNDIKYLVYGIDFMAFNKNRIIKNDFQEFYDLENKITNFENITNYDLYFNAETLVKSAIVIGKNILNRQDTEANYLANGMRDYINFIEQEKTGTLKLEKQIKKSIESYFKPHTGIYKNYQFSYEYLNYFKNIIKLCKTNDIKLFVFIPPMYSEHFDAIYSAGYFDEFEFFKKELIKITDFIDFTGHNSISTNKNNYWDSSHLRVEMTGVVMAKIFNDQTVDVPKDFGVLVTKENIDTHLENLKNQIKAYDASKLE